MTQTRTIDTLSDFSDDALLVRLKASLRRARRGEAELIAQIAEVERRWLYAREGCSSMFTYCTDILHLSELEAYLRIGAARASREHPMLLEMLVDGRLHLSGLVKLAPHLTRENRDAVLARAKHRSKREIEELIAALAPKPDVPAVIRKLPAPSRRVARESPSLAGVSPRPLREEPPPQRAASPGCAPRP